MGRHTGNINWMMLVLLALLGLFGLFLLLTTERPLFFQQGMYLVFGMLLIYTISRIDPEILWWLGPLAYIFTLLFLIISYFGPEIRGATRWIEIGPVRLQPSELVKPLIILALSRMITQFPPRTFRNIVLNCGLFIVPLILVAKQPDIGTGLVYISIFIAMMLAGGLKLRTIIISAVIGGFIAPFFWQHLEEYQKLRLLTFVSPALDPQGAGYNALQATIAIGSGRLFGRGLGFGTQSHLQFLPEYHTDFIFATLVEELGFLGGLLLLSIYAMLLWHIIMTARKFTDKPFPFIFSLGLFSMLLSQVFINAGMNMGILPITGITLPFVSYGGSSIISLSLTFGLFWAVTSRKTNYSGIAIN